MKMQRKQTYQTYSLFILGLVVTLFNTVNLQQNTVLIMSVPQYLLVFYYIFKKDYRTAFLLHAVFVTACVSRGIFIEEGVSPFLYIKCRVYGPLTFNIIVLTTLWFAVQGKKISVYKNSMLLSVRKILLYLLISGSVIGLIGCLFIKYYNFHYWVEHFLFVSQILLFVDIFIHLYTERYSQVFAKVVICLMAAAPVAAVVSFSLLGVHSYYGYDAMPLYNPIITLSPCLIIALFQLKNFNLKVISLIGLLFYVLHMMILSRGSQYLDVFVALVLLAYLVYFKNNASFQLKGLKILLPVFIIVVIPLAISEVTSSSDVSFNKFEQFTSLFSILDFSNNALALNFADIGSSPYIRVSELANIIYEGMHNIFAFIFGNGYGGYYTDSLHFFDGIDLSRGAFSDESAASGHFYTAHSAIPSVLHYNGLIGLFYMLRIAFLYLHRVDKTFMVFAAFVLFVQSFYFDMYGCFSYFMALFAAEYMINNASKKEVL